MIYAYDNTNTNMQIQLSDNFRLGEFRCRCGKCSITFIDSYLVSCLQVFRNFLNLPIVFNSAYRCPEHNAKQPGASRYSYHIKGQAVDIALPMVDQPQWIYVAKKIFPHVIVYTGKNFIHCDVRDLS